MQYVYVIQSKKDGGLYTGCTKDIKGRLILHNAKKVTSTKNIRRLRLYIMRRILVVKMQLLGKIYEDTIWKKLYQKGPK